MNPTTFETDLNVRPDDIDLNGHVHSPAYMAYVFAARFDQMERCYGVSMQDFLDAGLSWVVGSAQLDYKRPLKLGDAMRVRTRVSEIGTRSATVTFEILRMPDGKPSCTGWFKYVLVDAGTGRPAVIPDWIREKYSV